MVTIHHTDRQLGTQRRVSEAFLALAENPYPVGCVKLRGSGFYRTRIGDYRVIYAPDTNTRVGRLLAIGHRREIYRA